MTEYETACLDTAKLYYIKKFRLLQYDSNLLWIVDLIVESKFLFSKDEFVRVEEYYTKLMFRIQNISKQYQYNSTNFIFTQKPPKVIRNIIRMCCYLQIDVSSDFTYAAMMSLCAPLPVNWSYDQETRQYSCSNQKEFDAYKQSIQQTNLMQPILFHPIDPFLHDLISQNISQNGNVIYPTLQEDEFSKLPQNFVLLYDFRNLKVYVHQINEKTQYKLLNIALPKKAVYQSVFYKPEFLVAFMEIQQLVFRGQVNVSLRELPDLDVVENIKQIYDLQQSQNKLVKKQQIYESQRNNAQITNLLKLLDKKQRTQPVVDPQFISGQLVDFENKILFYGYVFVDKQTHRLLSQQQQQSPLNNQISCYKNCDQQVQLRISVAICKSEEIYSYMRTSELGNSKVLKQEFNTIDSNLQNNYNNKELIVINVDGVDYPFIDKNVTSRDFKIGMPINISNYNFVISQLSLEAKQYLEQNISILERFINKIFKCDKSGTLRTKYQDIVKQWKTFQYSVNEMGELLQITFQELTQIADTFFEVVEVKDIFE